MPEDVRFLREDIMSGRVTDIELQDWSYDQTLNRPGALNARVSTTAPDADEEILDPWKTAIYAVRGDVVEWGGILKPPSKDLGDETLAVSCFGWAGYWDRHWIRADVGQPEAGGVVVCRPKSDATTTNVVGNPDRTSLWKNIQGGYAPTQGVIGDGVPGHILNYRAEFDIPDLPTLHPVVSVTLNIVATALTAARTLTPQLHIGSTDYSGSSRVVSSFYGPTDCSYTWTTNPATGLAWTISDVEDFESGSAAGFFTDANTAGGPFGGDIAVNYLALTVKYAAGLSDFFTQTDQFDIFRALVLNAQSVERFGPGWDLGIDVIWDAKSGVLRDRLEAYQAAQAKNLGEALRQLAAVEDGFDFAMQYTLNPATDRIEKAIKLYYPTKGRDTGHLFEYERGQKTNIVSWGFADNVDFAWAGDGWGDGNDETRLKSTYVDDSLRGIYPPYEDAPTWSGVSDQATLDEHTAAHFERKRRPRRTPVVRVDPDRDPKWGTYEIGDTANFRIRSGYGSTPEPQPNRITGWKVASEGTFDLVLADPLTSTPASEDA